MTDMNELQEQEMIDRAKAGDPEANYQMSLWALEQAMAEPGEERWNRLAAKCLVKAAEAGYAPAQEKMSELLTSTEAKPAEAKPTAEEFFAAQPAAEQSASSAAPGTTRYRQTAASEQSQTPSGTEQLKKIAGQAGEIAVKAGKAAGKGAVKAGKAIAAGTSSLAKKVKAGLIKSSQARNEAAEKAAGSHSTQKKSILPDFSQWDDAKWKRMQIICVAICVVLAILIIVLIISGSKKSAPEAEEPGIKIPAADVAPTPELDLGLETSTPDNTQTEVPPTNVPEPVDEGYPSQATKDEIQAATLDVYPTEAEYKTEEQTVTVNTQSSPLKLRSGPGMNYRLLAELPRGTKLTVLAEKNNWALVKYNGTWGWCSYDYLRRG